MSKAQASATSTGETPGARGELVKRQSIWTRITHWVWVVCLFFLLLSGLQIFNAHPKLYVGQESGFEYDNAIFSIHAERRAGETVLQRLFRQQAERPHHIAEIEAARLHDHWAG